MRAVEVPEAGADFEVTEKPVPEPAADEVRVAIEACGVCHSDEITKEGLYPRIEFPRVPGHEVVGYVDAVGADVTEWEAGERVGVGWHGGHCFTCEACRRGDFINCENADVTGLDFDGGYAEYTVAPREALAAVPDGLDAVDAAPLLCAGITTFNALRNSDARPGDLVAVQGVGGLGHLGIQYAHEAGFEVVALSRGTEKETHARELGADHYVDTEAEDPAEALQKLGGASVVLATAPSAPAIESVVGGLGTDGEVLAVGIPESPVGVHAGMLVGTRGSVSGWASGTAKDSQDTLEFSALRDVTPEIETFDLADAAEAYDRMMASEVRFRAVLEP
ncbi:alcohol dehydrogenase [Halarchaeum acidiphilum]|uniref:alcohol dehydrogenase n=1 Tax=Halarchaeum acidiphilum TaxID=489138 RepID=UPI0006775EBD